MTRRPNPRSGLIATGAPPRRLMVVVGISAGSFECVLPLEAGRRALRQLRKGGVKIIVVEDRMRRPPAIKKRTPPGAAR